MADAFSKLEKLWMPIVEESGVLDLLRVADMHRRHAHRPSDGFLVREISEAFYKFSCAFTNLGDEKLLAHADHSSVIRMLSVYLCDIAARARIAGAEEILMPVEPDSAWAGFISDLADKNSLGMPLRFSAEPYSIDLSEVASIDPSVTMNPLHKDSATGSTVRGLWNIDSDLKYKWDAEMAPRTRKSRPASHHP